MAVNDSRSMNEDFEQGSIDSTYIQLAPDRGSEIEVLPLERLSWPTYAQAERHADHPFWESMTARLPLPRERKTADSGDLRY